MDSALIYLRQIITNFADTHSTAAISTVAFGAFSVCWQSLVGTHQGDIEEVLVLLDLGEGGGDVGVEVIPAQAELLRGHFWWEKEEWKVEMTGEEEVTCRSPPRGGRFLVWLLQLVGRLAGI